jgi:hypothetical protein
MKFLRIIFPLFMILLAISACTSPPVDEEYTSEITVIGLYPAGNGQYSILASKSVRDNNAWVYYDSLMFLLVDADGNKISTTGLPLQNQPYIRQQYLLNDGNIMLFGNLSSDNYSWYFSTAVYSPSGALVWNMNMADRTSGVIPESNGGLFTLGWAESPDLFDRITYAKMESNGDTTWSRIIKSTSYNVNLNSGTPTSDGGCIAIGETYVADRSNDILVVRINAAGDTLWTGSFGGDSYDNVNFVKELNDGGILVAGTINLYDSTNANWGLNSGEQVYLIKLSANGDKLWTKAVGKTLRESINAIIETTDGSLVLCGTRSESYVYIYDSTEGWVTKLSADGNEIWLREYEKKIPTGVRELSNGDLLVVTRNLDAEYDWRDSNDLDLMKFSSTGTLLWDKVLTP